MSPRKVIRRSVYKVQPISTKSLPHMPLDILLEVFGYLEPQDLLFLARTSKSFRRFLLNRRNARSLWKNAIRNVGGLPERPAGFSELAWINLLFSPHCHHCLKDDVQKILWEFGVRYCDQCKKTKTAIWSWKTFDLTSPRTSGMWHPGYINSLGRGERVHIPEVEEFKRTWEETNEKDRDALLEERFARVDDINELADEGRDWMKWLERDRETEDVREKRELFNDFASNLLFSHGEEMGEGFTRIFRHAYEPRYPMVW